MYGIKPLTEYTMKLYNEYVDWLNEWMNFEDRSVGLYATRKLTERNIDEIMDCFPENKLMYWNEDTLVMKDGKFLITIKLVLIGEDSNWIIAKIF